MKIGIVLLSLFYALASIAVVSFQGKDLLTEKPVSFPTAQAKGSVIVFLSAKCPCSASHEPKLAALYQEFSKQGFEFIAVHSNQDESVEFSKEHFKKAALPFPVVHDSEAKIANQLKALKTPHAYVFVKGEVVFEGGVDDSANAAHSKEQYLTNALREISLGKKVTVAQARALGCVIKR